MNHRYSFVVKSSQQENYHLHLRSTLQSALKVSRLVPFVEKAGFVLTTDIATKLIVLYESRAVSSSLILKVTVIALIIVTLCD